MVSVGTVAAFVLWLNYLFEPINQLSQLYNTVQSAGAALNKIFGVLDTRPSIAERPGAVDLPADGEVEVEHVTFAYGDDPVLHDLSLTIAAGERIALVGPTGAGKSTLAKLIARFYDPTEGDVRADGVDLRDATLRSLRERVVVVPQEGFLFAGSLRDNVRIGRPEASNAEVDDALEALACSIDSAGFPKDSRRRYGNADRACPRANASWYLSRARRSPIRRSSCSTKPPRTSIPVPSTRSRRRSNGSCTGARSWWSHTGCRRRRAPIGSR